MANVAHDIMLDDSGDLSIANGDFVVAASDIQSMQLILNTAQGQWKQWPLIGAWIWQYMKGVFNGTVKRAITLQLMQDSFTGISISMSSGVLTIEGNRNN